LQAGKKLMLQGFIGEEPATSAGTFRHTYRSWLDETGAPMKVQQELMRHASIQTTMNVYGRAMTDSKRKANSQVVGLVFGETLHGRKGGLNTKVLQL
jgi:integrase